MEVTGWPPCVMPLPGLAVKVTLLPVRVNVPAVSARLG